ANFDAVISTSVLEHARNKTELFAEVHRVLRPGGATFHVYPSKYYLPAEPHIHVPLVSWLWPRVPRVWLAIWALAGVRNEFQRGMPWREVVRSNAEYCAGGLSYWSNRAYRAALGPVFGAPTFPRDLYIRHSEGRAAAVARRLPWRRATGWLIGT